MHEARERDLRERAAFLDEACAGDDALRSEVESLLAEDSEVRNEMRQYLGISYAVPV